MESDALVMVCSHPIVVIFIKRRFFISEFLINDDNTHTIVNIYYS